jgi:membrane-associated protein
VLAISALHEYGGLPHHTHVGKLIWIPTVIVIAAIIGAATWWRRRRRGIDVLAKTASERAG